MSRLVVVGDVIVDRAVTGTVERVCPDAPVPVVDCDGETARPGGAGLAAVLGAAAGHDVVLVAPTVDDEAGRELEELLADAGVELCPLPATGSTREKTRVRAGGQSLVRLDRGMLVPSGELPTALPAVLGRSDAILVADYGGGTTALPALRRVLEQAGRSRPVVWDPHVRGVPCTPGTTLVTPNERELAALAPTPIGLRAPGPALGALGRSLATSGDVWSITTDAARALVTAWRPAAVAVTLGARGALLVTEEGTPLVIPARSVTVLDPCGAGDCLAVTAAAALAEGAVLSEAVAKGVAAAARFVSEGPLPPQRRLGGRSGNRPAGSVAAPGASGGEVERPGAGNDSQPTTTGGGVEWAGVGDGLGLAAAVRRAGGTVVVAGGCFDLLHRGHVELLRTARDLGDCLVVALNSDRSVRMIKGEGRPIMPAVERAAVLSALAAVDAVMPFDEPTPAEVLRRLRPHLFVKGGDYAGLPLAEQAVLAEWGGQVVAVPYLGGRSTTRIVEEVRRAR